MKRFLVLAGVLLLTSCGGEQYGDLKQELANATKDLRGRVDPLPQVKPYEPVPYKAFDQADPFSTAKIELVTKSASSGGGGLKPDFNRPKEPLEAYPLESLKMVGVLSQGGVNYALINANRSLYRVKAGNYLGQNFGVITDITENQINLKELVLDTSGDWTERKVSLQLIESEAARGR